MDRDSLLELATRHMARFPTTRRGLRDVLHRKLSRAAAGDQEPLSEDASDMVEGVLRELEERGVVDDALFARLRLSSLRRAGHSARAIRAKLQQQGVAGDCLKTVMADENPETELAAARRYVRRRRLGVREERLQKDLASLARAGFSYDVAQRALTPDPLTTDP